MLQRDEAGFYYSVPVKSEEETTEETHTISRVPRLYYWRDLVEYPKLVARLYDTYVHAGHNARLEIRATGFPVVDVQWYKDWHPIYETDNFKVIDLINIFCVYIIILYFIYVYRLNILNLMFMYCPFTMYQLRIKLFIRVESVI